MADAENTQLEPAVAPSRLLKYRWVSLFLILLIGIGLQTAAWLHFADQRTYQVFSFYPVTGATCLGLILWWWFLSGFKRKREPMVSVLWSCSEFYLLSASGMNDFKGI
ncbi:MAG: hypothetical protein R3C11_21735 [Planctomycetaceae bacterium]